MRVTITSDVKNNIKGTKHKHRSLINEKSQYLVRFTRPELSVGTGSSKLTRASKVPGSAATVT